MRNDCKYLFQTPYIISFMDRQNQQMLIVRMIRPLNEAEIPSAHRASTVGRCSSCTALRTLEVLSFPRSQGICLARNQRQSASCRCHRPQGMPLPPQSIPGPLPFSCFFPWRFGLPWPQDAGVACAGWFYRIVDPFRDIRRRWRACPEDSLGPVPCFAQQRPVRAGFLPFFSIVPLFQKRTFTWMKGLRQSMPTPYSFAHEKPIPSNVAFSIMLLSGNTASGSYSFIIIMPPFRGPLPRDCCFLGIDVRCALSTCCYWCDVWVVHYAMSSSDRLPPVRHALAWMPRRGRMKMAVCLRRIYFRRSYRTQD